jgi:hypothetical protein
MKRVLPILLVVFTGGCSANVPSAPWLYKPGRSVLLTVRIEEEQAGVFGEHYVGAASDGLEEPLERLKGWQMQWREFDLPVEVRPSPRIGCLALSAKIARTAGGSSYQAEWQRAGAPRHNVPAGAALGSSTQACTEGAEEPGQTEDVSYLATADRSGRILSFDARGGDFESLKRQWAEDHLSANRKQMAIRFHSRGVFSALSDAAAYLPPPDVRRGRKWHVARDKVFPYDAYGFTMMTYGCGFSRESSTCVAQEIDQTTDGRVVTVRITGRRYPQGGPVEGMPKRMDYMDTSGELRFNLDTQSILSLRIQTKPVWLRAEDKEMSMSSTNILTLKRRQEGCATQRRDSSLRSE